MGRIITIGDVHGCLDELQDLVARLRISSEDRVLMLGDLLDRGPDPVGVVRYVRSVGFGSILSNHEEKAIRWRRYEARRAQTGASNPMRAQDEKRRSEWEALSSDDLEWLQNLPVTVELNDAWTAVHAGFEPGRSMATQRRDKMLRVRFIDGNGEMVPFEDGKLSQPDGTAYWTSAWRGPKNVVYGHAVHSLESPRIDQCDGGSLCVGIDTGVVFGGRLTAMVLRGDEREFVQVSAAREYYPLRSH